MVLLDTFGRGRGPCKHYWCVNGCIFTLKDKKGKKGEEKNPPSLEINNLFLYIIFNNIQNVKKTFVKQSLRDLINSKVFVESHCNVYSAIHKKRLLHPKNLCSQEDGRINAM